MDLVARTEVGDLARDLFADAIGEGTIDDVNALWVTLRQVGLADLTCAPELGGSGGSHAQLFEVLFEVGRAGAATPLVEHDLVANWLIAAAGVKPPGGRMTFAVLDDRSARASRTAWARDADHIVLVRHRLGQDHVLVVPAGCVHLTRGSNVAREPRDAASFDLADLDHLEWLAIDLGRPAPDPVLLRAAAGRLAMMAGAAQRVVEVVTGHVTTREQFGRPLVGFQAVQHALAGLVADTALMQACAREALVCFDTANSPPDVPVHGAGVVVGDLAGRVCEVGHQLLGAIGTTLEHELHRSTTRLWAWRDEYLTSDQHAEALGGLATSAARRDPWLLVTG